MTLHPRFLTVVIIISLVGAGALGVSWWYDSSRLFPHQAGMVWHFHMHRSAMNQLATEFERSDNSKRFACYPELERLTFERANENQTQSTEIDPQVVASFNTLCINAGLMVGSRMENGVLLPVGEDRKWNRDIWISYARLSGSSTTPACDAAVAKASVGAGYCDVHLDEQWVIHYQWFPPNGD